MIRLAPALLLACPLSLAAQSSDVPTTPAPSGETRGGPAGWGAGPSRG